MGSKLPLQAAVIVIHLRETYQTKDESGSLLKNAAYLFVDGVTTNDLFLGLKEGTVFRIDLADCDLAAYGIPLAEHFAQIPFHPMTEGVAHDPSSRLKTSR